MSILRHLFGLSVSEMFRVDMISMCSNESRILKIILSAVFTFFVLLWPVSVCQLFRQCNKFKSSIGLVIYIIGETYNSSLQKFSISMWEDLKRKELDGLINLFSD